MNTRFRRPGATMIDVLVVADIVGVMAALLLPSLQAAREMARKNVCRNQMRQLMVAMHGHVEEIVETIDRNTYLRLITRAGENPDHLRDFVRPEPYDPSPYFR